MNFPYPMQVVARIALEASGNREEVRSKFYDRLLGLNADWSGEIQPASVFRYAGTPAELMPMASYGVDGAHAGLVIHAPELNLQDYLVGSYCEIDGMAVQFAGRDSRHFIEMRLSAMLQCWHTLDQDKGWREKIKIEREKYSPYLEKIARELHLKPRADMKIFGWGQGENEVDLRAPDVHAGWHYMPSDDNVGVLAPTVQFDPTYTKYDNEDGFRTARVLKNRGFPASALLVLKQFLWRNRLEKHASEILEEMLPLYETLGRPMHVEATKATIAIMKQLETK